MAGTAAKFVQIVEKYPCLYKINLAEYARKDITEKAWSEVANEIKWSVHESKEKWKNIRNGFVRSLKPKASGSATNKKKYYLHDEMQFVLPYVKPVIHTEERGNLPSPQEPTQNHEPASPEEYTDVDSNRNTAEETGSEHVSQVERPSFKKPKTKIKPVNNEADKAFVDWLKQRKSNEDDPRKMFLLSLLPDVQSLTDEQMSAFRIKVLMLLEEIKKPTCSPTQIRSDQYRNYSPISSVYSYSSQAQASTTSPPNYSAPNSSMSQYSNQYRADYPLSSIYSQAQATISDPINYSVTNLSTMTNIEFSQNINDFGDFTTQKLKSTCTFFKL